MKLTNKIFKVTLFVGVIVVGLVSNNLSVVNAQVVSLINLNVTANPATVPPEGGVVTYTYTVTNLGSAPLTNVTVTDTGCSQIQGPTGDVNFNSLLEANENWFYNCGAIVMTTTNNTATAQGDSGGQRHTAVAPTTVAVGSVGVPEAGIGPEDMQYVWMVFAAIMAISGLFLGLKFKRGF